MASIVKELDKIFKPSSVAVIGASKDEKKWGNIIVKRLIDGGFKGKIYPINPKGEEVLGIKTYRSVKDIEGTVDLAVITVQSKYVYSSISDCLEKGAGGFVVNTAGFGETGLEGKKVEREIVEFARKNGARIVGPNCMGIFSAPGLLNTNLVPDMKPGPIAALAQSGNIFILLYEEAIKRDLGFSAFVSLGNQADLQFYEYVQYFSEDPETKIILLYIEDIKQGRNFFNVASKAGMKKPILAIKAGHSQSGSRAAASHTGSLAGFDAIYEASFKQAGVVRIKRTDEIFPVAETLLKCPLPKSDRVYIFTDGGGFSVLAGDAAEDRGFNLVELSKESKDKLREILPPFANVNNNPLDTAADYPLMTAKCTEIMIADENVDVLVFYGVLGGYDFFFFKDYEEEEKITALRIAELSRQYNKPVIIVSPYADSNNLGMKTLKEQNIPLYSSIEQALAAVSALTNYASFRNQVTDYQEFEIISKIEGVDKIIKKACREKRTVLLETEAREILKEYGIDMPRHEISRSAEEAAELAADIGFPVVMKILSKDVIHKSDVGGVKLNLHDKKAVKKAYKEIIHNVKERNRSVEIEGVLITQQQFGDTDIIIGLQNDPQFGPSVMFGMGGIFVEIMKDVAFRLAPFGKQEALKMMQETKGFKILTGIRGQKRKDIDSVSDLLVRVGKIGIDNPEIESIDLNPIRVMEKGVVILDARVILNNLHK